MKARACGCQMELPPRVLARVLAYLHDCRPVLLYGYPRTGYLFATRRRKLLSQPMSFGVVQYEGPRPRREGTPQLPVADDHGDLRSGGRGRPAPHRETYSGSDLRSQHASEVGRQSGRSSDKRCPFDGVGSLPL